jgi:hypothetical protein
VLINHNEEQIQLNKGQVIVTTISNKMVALDRPSTVLTVDSNGNTQGPIPMNQPLVNFADLGAPVTNTAFADVQNAFAAVTGHYEPRYSRCELAAEKPAHGADWRHRRRNW